MTMEMKKKQASQQKGVKVTQAMSRKGNCTFFPSQQQQKRKKAKFCAFLMSCQTSKSH